jgi:alcohol dehydrogenase
MTDGRIADFEFSYAPSRIRYGRGTVDSLAATLEDVGVSRALVVAGESTGTAPAVGGRVVSGLEPYHVGTYAGSSPAKRIETAHQVASRAAALNADVLVAVGGGSAVDVATVGATLAAMEASSSEARRALREGELGVPAGVEPLPIVAIPTTLAGAELSVVAGITDAPRAPGEPVRRGGVSDGRLLPTAVVYDRALYETTPGDVLRASLMNGFDKGVETLYARTATPITDATAMRGLSLLREGVAGLAEGAAPSEGTLHRCILGTMLVQYGCSRGQATTLSILHAFGHGVARGFAIQQGDAHAIVAPHALSALFESVDGRRTLLAEALGVDETGAVAIAAGVVDAVTQIRDTLGLATQLRAIEDMQRDDLPTIARLVVVDGFMRNRPRGYDPTAADIQAVLERAW